MIIYSSKRAAGRRSGSLRTRMRGSSSVMSAYRDGNLPGPGDFDPPEYDEPNEIDEYTSEIEIEIDADIEVDTDSSFYFIDETVPWAYNPDSNSGDWEDENGVLLAFGDDAADYVQDVIAPRIPAKPGKYHLNGVVLLAFRVSGGLSYNFGSRRDPDYQDNYEDAQAKFDFNESRVESLNIS